MCHRVALLVSGAQDRHGDDLSQAPVAPWMMLAVSPGVPSTTESPPPLMVLIVSALLIVMALAGLVAALAATSEHGPGNPRAIRVPDRMSELRRRLEP